MAGLDVTPRSESCSTIRASSPESISPRASWSSHTLVPAAVSAARRSFTAVALIPGTLRPVGHLVGSGVARAVCAAVHRPAGLVAVADDLAAAVRARRRERVDRALERVE